MPAQPRPPAAAPDERFWQQAHTALLGPGPLTFGKLVLTQAQGLQGDSRDLERVVARPIHLRGALALSLVYSHRTRDVTRNLPPEHGLATLRALLGQPGLRHAHLRTATLEWQLSISKKGKPLLARHALAPAGEAPAGAPASATAAPAAAAAAAAAEGGLLAHDRPRQRLIDLDAAFLQALGVTTLQGGQAALVPAMARKWRQINKFVEVFAHALSRSRLAEASRVSVADFGAGRGYLTFAVHDFLVHGRQVEADVVGVELRPDLVAEANASSASLQLQGLRFEAGDVSSLDSGAVNVVIALHACDTATDHAIHLGLRGGADIILCSPCCHKQLRPQLLSPHPLRPVFAHGIHAEQQAEMLTDSLRALLLETQGYDTQVFEFITLEHTRKNKMILAVRRPGANAAEGASAWAQIDALKAFFGIREQALEQLLRTPAAGVPAAPGPNPRPQT